MSARVTKVAMTRMYDEMRTSLGMNRLQLETNTLEQQITKVHMATMTGLIVDAMPDKIERMIAILVAAEKEADDALHKEAFSILRQSLEHAVHGQGKTPTRETEKATAPTWLKGVIDGKKDDEPSKTDD